MVQCFTKGKTIDEMAEEFGCTKLTITRNLKKSLGDEKYKELANQNKTINQSINVEEINNSLNNKNVFETKDYEPNTKNEFSEEEFLPLSTFTEITPLNYEIENAKQKDLSSVPISEIEFPKMVYMIVDKNIELVTKYLKEYPDWQFLSQEELNRKTIEIYFDLKLAKRYCNKEQKIIKVPNTNVFKLAAPQLLNKGISRIVGVDKLIAL